MARAAPLDMESEATTCGSALSKDAVNGVLYSGRAPVGRGLSARRPNIERLVRLFL